MLSHSLDADTSLHRYQPVAMKDVDEIPLMDSRKSTSGDQDDSDSEENGLDIQHAELKPTESKKTRLLVLIASGIIQLPIWGTLGHIPGWQRHLRKRRFRYKLRRIPGILLQQLDIGRRPQYHWCHRNDR